MTSEYCPECRRMHRPGIHLPLWRVYCPGDDERIDDARTINAASAEDAAERWAEDDDDGGDYRIVGGHDVIVVVVAADCTRSKWRVGGESIPTYYAWPVKEELTP